MTRRRPTLYVVDTPIIYFTGIKNRSFENDQIKVEENGRIEIKAGFRSDGNSPTTRAPLDKYIQLGWVIGPPNGPRDRETGLPISYRAFMLHDALLDNCKHLINIAQIHQEYCREINLTNWRWRKLACWLVRKFGPRK